MSSLAQNGHSAQIDAYLLLGDKQLRISQIGGGTLMLHDHAIASPSTQATVVVSVDGLEQRMPVTLVNGIQPGSESVEYRR